MALENGLAISYKVKHGVLPYDLAVPILAVSRREMKAYSHTRSWAQMSIATLFVVAKSGKAPRSPFKGDWMKRPGCIH